MSRRPIGGWKETRNQGVSALFEIIGIGVFIGICWAAVDLLLAYWRHL